MSAYCGKCEVDSLIVVTDAFNLVDQLRSVRWSVVDLGSAMSLRERTAMAEEKRKRREDALLQMHIDRLGLDDALGQLSNEASWTDAAVKSVQSILRY